MNIKTFVQVISSLPSHIAVLAKGPTGIGKSDIVHQVGEKLNMPVVDRRLIFVHEARVDAVDRDGLHLRGGTLDLRIFKRRPGELLLSEDVYGKETNEQTSSVD